MRFVAFLRGINVGGHAVVSMAVLRDAFRRLGFLDARTVLASGNVVFTAGTGDGNSLAARIAAALAPVFRREVGVIVRALSHIEGLRAAAPFAGIAVTPAIRLYVSFLPHEAAKSSLPFPYAAPGGGFRILEATAGEVFSVLDLGKGGTPEAIAFLEREFGPGLTTRNWSTVLKTLAPGGSARPGNGRGVSRRQRASAPRSRRR
jgi:uncharacterized protein (DUF1697 family)